MGEDGATEEVFCAEEAPLFAVDSPEFRFRTLLHTKCLQTRKFSRFILKQQQQRLY
jgi:hypothetical protein